MSRIRENIQQLLDKNKVYEFTLVAVSKTKPPTLIREAYETGHRDFGENKVQELTDKYQALPKDIRWHMIGHLQRNKVKYIAPFVHLIHGVDSEKLLAHIDKEAEKAGRIIPCLLQVHIARESTKFGFTADEVLKLASSGLTNYKYVQVVGLMGMATNTTDENIIKDEFSSLKSLYDRLSHETTMNILSMGMSGDYKIALQEGSNMIRIGSAIFGARNYDSNQ